MEDETVGKLLGELRRQVNDLAAAVQLLSPLVNEHGQTADVGRLANANKSLYQLIRTICHLELCQNEDPVFCPREMDAMGLCRDLGREVEYPAELLGVEFDWQVGKQGQLALVDEQLLRLAVFNMLSNAFQAAGEGGWVKMRCTLGGGKMEVAVSDSGMGLQSAEGKENPLLAQKGAGLGLGLETARRVAFLHGGRLILGSAKDSGVRAVLSLPLRRGESDAGVKTGSGMDVDIFGGYSPVMVEFSPLLKRDSFLKEQEE